MIKNNKKTEKIYDLEERTFKFARDCRDFVKKLPRTISNEIYGKQLIRSSSSPAANHIEANENLGTKDFLHKIKICRKESKESRLWLRLCTMGDNLELEKERQVLVQEASELMKIFGSIVRKSQS